MNEKKPYRYIVPYSRNGKYSIILMALFFLCILIFNILARSGQRGGEHFFSNPWLSMALLAAILSALVSFVLGIVSVIRSKERSFFVFISIIVGFFVVLWTAAEIFFPHQ